MQAGAVVVTMRYVSSLTTQLGSQKHETSGGNQILKYSMHFGQELPPGNGITTLPLRAGGLADPLVTRPSTFESHRRQAQLEVTHSAVRWAVRPAQ